MTSKHPPPWAERAEISKIWAFFTKKGLILQEKNHPSAEIHNLGGHYKWKLLEKWKKRKRPPTVRHLRVGENFVVLCRKTYSLRTR